MAQVVPIVAQAQRSSDSLDAVYALLRVFFAKNKSLGSQLRVILTLRSRSVCKSHDHCLLHFRVPKIQTLLGIIIDEISV